MNSLNITPEEALYAVYKFNFEMGATTVYNMPVELLKEPNTTLFAISSPDPTAPDETVAIARDTEGECYLAAAF